MRRSGRQLSLAIDQLSSELDDNLLRTGGDAKKVFVAYAADHHHEPRL
ncbi:hypothetical protein [Ornithinimicrobium flavum]|nr:hypothetical protein [Ornithinimicrobium flavum]